MQEKHTNILDKIQTKRCIPKGGHKKQIHFCSKEYSDSYTEIRADNRNVSDYRLERRKTMRANRELFHYFAPGIRKALEQTPMDFEKLQEIRLRTGSPLFVWYDGNESAVGVCGGLTKDLQSAYSIAEQDLRETLQLFSSYSLYAYEDEVRHGFLTVAGGHRAGICGRAVTDNGAVRSFQYVSAMNIRLAHQIKGSADPVMRYVRQGKEPLSTLIISPPRCGKTTLLRDLIRQFSNGTANIPGKNVGVVDERSEIGGCYMGIPQNDIGIRTDILDCCPKVQGIMMLIRSMAPDIIAVDEIGDMKDADAVRAAFYCGCRLLATVHGSSMEDIRQKPLFRQLMGEGMFERYLLLDHDRIGTLQAVYDRDGKTLFDSVKGSEREC